jgi:hypothetical protein
MTVPLILVPGTHAVDASQADTAEWYWPGRPFWQAAVVAGVALLGEHDPFEWSSNIGGLGPRKFTEWKPAADALRWYGQLKVTQRALYLRDPVPDPQVVSILAHSHGGNVAAYAAARAVKGFRVDTLILAATPIRADMVPIYAEAVTRCRRVIYLETGGHDLWRRLGLLGGGVGTLPPGVEMVRCPDADHRDVLDPARWTRLDWWTVLLGVSPRP